MTLERIKRVRAMVDDLDVKAREIAENSRLQISLTDELIQLEDELHEIEADVRIGVEDMYATTKDTSLSNAQKRTLETERLLKKNLGYAGLKNRETELHHQIRNLKITMMLSEKLWFGSAQLLRAITEPFTCPDQNGGDRQ